MSRNKYCVANWKMNFAKKDISFFAKEWQKKDISKLNIKTIFCPSFTDLDLAINLFKGMDALICAQNVSEHERGAYTGEISTEMIKEVGCNWVLIGHSERRTIYNETNAVIEKKLKNIIEEKLNPIICVGETKSERDSGMTEEVLKEQVSILHDKNINYISELVIAYEPVWAIGTGDVANSDLIVNTHKIIRNILLEQGIKSDSIYILYGGSVNESNISELSNFSDIDGFLVGGASLDVNKFYTIYNKL